MYIPIGAPVKCRDGACGHSTYVVINPISQTITDVVVKEEGFNHPERLVAVKHVVSSSPDGILLDCSRPDLEAMPPFMSVEFIAGDSPHMEYGPDQYLFLPYDLPPADLEPEYIPLEHEQIPPDEMAIHRGTRVEATDGGLGHVSEFLVNPENGHITHLVLRKGHLWNTHEITIPVTYIKTIGEETVYLTVDKATAEALPAAPIQHMEG